MAQELHPKSLPTTLHSFSFKPPSQITTTALKIKTIIEAYFSRRMSHVVRAVLHIAKRMAIELLNTKSTPKNYIVELRRKQNYKKTKKFFCSIRMCFTSSSHVIPMSEPRSIEGFDAINHEYYDSTWKSMISTNEGNDDMEPPLSGYLRWLEEKDIPDALVGNKGGSEIDRLAEKFIQRCHEKFWLEKQESYRMYQEMLARSI